jgi:hypothetical protein
MEGTRRRSGVFPPHGRIEVGEPLTEFQGVLTGVPTFVGDDGNLALKASR